MAGNNKRRRLWTYGSNSIVATIFFLAILTVAAIIAQRHPWRVDLTESGKFTLSEQTRNILNSLTQPVQIKAFYATASPEYAKAKDLLDTYRYYSKQISYELIDPDRQPEVARRYEVRAYGTLVLEGFDKKQTVQNADEDSITNALLKLTRKEEKKIYFLIGHGEHSINGTEKEGYSSVRTALEKENHAVAELNLLQQAQVPADAAEVIIAGPKKPLFSQELDSLKAYLDGGGKLVVFLDPYYDGGMRDFLRSYGVQLSDDIVIDKLSRVFGGSYLMPVVTQYGPHKITANFDLATFYPEARSVRPMKEAQDKEHAEVLFSTSADSWAETNLEQLKQGQASFDEKEDQAGPVPLAVLASVDVKAAKPEPQDAPKQADNDKKPGTPEKPQGNKEGMLLVAGNSNFANNTYFGLSGNGDMFLNMANFMAEEENLVTVDRHQKTGGPLIMTQSQAQLLLWLVLVFVPLAVILVGLGVYRVRRSQR